MKNVISALKSKNKKEIKAALTNAINEKRVNTLKIKKIAVASEIFNQG